MVVTLRWVSMEASDDYGFLEIPRQGDYLRFDPPLRGKKLARVEAVTWMVTERGCRAVEALLR